MSDERSPHAGTVDRVQKFLKWFSALEADDQDVLMSIVYKEKKIRDVVKSLGAMGLEQRREVFERLGLPSDLVSRIPAPDPAALTDAEVEWVDWQAPGS
jgi:hypothetical protein